MLPLSLGWWPIVPPRKDPQGCCVFAWASPVTCKRLNSLGILPSDPVLLRAMKSQDSLRAALSVMICKWFYVSIKCSHKRGHRASGHYY